MNTDIPFVDLQAQFASLREELLPRLTSVMERASFILGPEVAQFERDFASYIGSKHCIGLSSGTAALQVGLRALDIGPGDEVIIPANTYIASAIAISAVGADPVLVDVDQYYLMEPEAVERAITRRTKAIMPVHLYGQMVPMDNIVSIARRNGLRVIEDAAQAHGAKFNGRRAGSFGDVAAFSFYPGKNLGCYGDGGALVTSSDDLADKIRLFRDFGQRRKYEHLIKGDNCRLDGLQATVLSVKLPYLDAWNAARLRNAKRYDSLLASLGIQTPGRYSDEGHVYHLYVVQIKERDAVQRDLAAAGVQTGIHYPVPLHLQPAYAELMLGLGSFPRTEAAASKILSLPMFPELRNEDIERIGYVLSGHNI